MAGHMGDKIRTIQNLEIIKSDLENNLIFLKGSVPGSKNSTVLVKTSAKNISRLTLTEKVKKLQSQKPESSSKPKANKTDQAKKPDQAKKEDKK
jgi:large subunit ribosomal protein L3